MNIVIMELSYIGGTIIPPEVANSLLLAIFEVSFVFSVVRPNLQAVAVLLIVEPTTNILLALVMLVCASSFRLVI